MRQIHGVGGRGAWAGAWGPESLPWTLAVLPSPRAGQLGQVCCTPCVSAKGSMNTLTG